MWPNPEQVRDLHRARIMEAARRSRQPGRAEPRNRRARPAMAAAAPAAWAR